jgi:copper(I)-binding protein
VELVELHNHIKEGEAMRMVSVPTITIPAGKTVSFAPGGLHIMLMGLPEGGLATDSTVTITLDFGEAGSLAVDAKVSKPAGGDHAHKHHHHH